MPNPELDRFQAHDSELAPDEVKAELEALYALAQVDAEVAVVCEIVAQDTSARSLRDMLVEFVRDHRRHVDEIGAYLSAQGVEPAGDAPDPEGSAFAALASALSAMEPCAGLSVLSASTAYAAAGHAALLELSLGGARSLIEQSLSDLRRHQRWLADHADAVDVSQAAR